MLRLDAADNVLCCIALLDSMPDTDRLAGNMSRLAQRDVSLRSCPAETSTKGWAPIGNFDAGDWIVVLDPGIDAGDPFACAARHLPGGFEQGSPMWRIHVLPGCGPDGSGAALVFYVHHALVDGLRGMSVIQQFSDAGAVARGVGHGAEAGYRMRESLTAPWKLLRLLAHEWTTGHFLPKPKSGEAVTGRTFQPVLGGVEALRRQSRAHCLSFHDAMLTVGAAAMGDLVEQHGGVRPQRVPTVVPYLSRCAKRFRLNPNGVLPLLASVPTDAATALEHIGLTRASVARAVSAMSPEAHDIRARLYARLPAMLRHAVHDICARKTDLLFSIIPGPQQALSFGGAKASALYGLPALIDAGGMALCLVTYNGRVFGAAASGRTAAGEVRQVAEAVSARTDRMLEALQNA